ncbi:hypothetical protein [Nocardia aurea]|uniref:hypothetical protein n=1 Tax=Nocardia aurea TaxID=2144174 RepID=UPI0033A7CF93
MTGASETEASRRSDRRSGAESTRTAVVFEYSQTGQLIESVDALVAPLIAANWQVRRVRVEPASPFPFPWPVTRFFGAFPACVDEEYTVELSTPAERLRSEPGELVLFAYQVWYLAPSLPARTLLVRHREIFAERDVVTVVACRNMWYSAAGEVHRRLTAVGARTVGAVAAIDTRPQAITLVTTLRWLLLGRRDGGLFGRAGVGTDELSRLAALGREISATKTSDDLATVLRDADAAPVVPLLAAADLLAGSVFRRWGAGIRRASEYGVAARVAALTAFVGSLGVAIAVGFPALALARLLGRARFDRIVGTRLDRVLGRSTISVGASS